MNEGRCGSQTASLSRRILYQAREKLQNTDSQFDSAESFGGGDSVVQPVKMTLHTLVLAAECMAARIARLMQAFAHDFELPEESVGPPKGQTSFCYTRCPYLSPEVEDLVSRFADRGPGKQHGREGGGVYQAKQEQTTKVVISLVGGEKECELLDSMRSLYGVEIELLASHPRKRLYFEEKVI
ncbi:hypothetical protein SELMODRAFT_414553 [Selaginella moellendorffii]|uniref:Uncharacterized protein n=1 Tax=Selaginella moellendorffii TaxID=88036 RepID=D8RT53_SELML|nr:hypothetical protein SELMODRAFT_414553 [Selaginella moellendorffii]